MADDWRTIGTVPIEVYRSELARLGSPMLREVEAVHAAAGEHSALALAMMFVEQKYGTLSSIPSELHNPLSLAKPSGGPQHDRWMRFSTWAEGVRSWRERISDPTYKGGIYAKTTTLEDLIRVYAPPSENDTNRYIAVVNERIAAYRALQATEEASLASPTIYMLSSDYARYGLTQSQANEVLSHRFFNRRDAASGVTGGPEFIVLHIQDGTTPGSLKWWTGVQASSTVMAQKDGSLLRVIPEAHGPWTNGDVMDPTAQAAEILALGGNPNIWTLSLEAEGTPYEAHPPAMLDAIEWQVRDWMGRYEIPASRVLRHGWINSRTRANCPGSYFDEIMRRIGATIVPKVDYPEYLDKGLAERMFGEVMGEDGKVYAYDEGGSISALWLAEYGKYGWPRIDEVWSYEGGARRYVRFLGGPTIFVGADGKPVIVGVA